MDEAILIESEGENSIIEVEVPKKVLPPVIDIGDDDIFINIERRDRKTLLAKDVIDSEKEDFSMSGEISAFDSDSHNFQISKLISPDHWTLDMMKFYNEKWEDVENFTVEKIQEKMDKNPMLWPVLDKEILHPISILDIHRKTKCYNCHQRGHPFYKCPEPKRIPNCRMCGDPGHYEQFCPDSVCLGCGNPARTYVKWCKKCIKWKYKACSRCKVKGHHFKDCTDHWRKYHLTTEGNDVRIPDTNVYKEEKDMWCCHCGTRGHNQVNCKQKSKDNGFICETIPVVASYSKSFNDVTMYRKRERGRKRRKERRREKERKKRRREEVLTEFNPMSKVIKNTWKLRKSCKREAKIRLRNRKRNETLLSCVNF